MPTLREVSYGGSDTAALCGNLALDQKPGTAPLIDTCIKSP